MPGKRRLLLYTASHLLVDFVCFTVLFGFFVPASPSLETTALAFLCYNTVAFGLQMFMGLWMDTARFPARGGQFPARGGRIPPFVGAAAGCALVGIGALCGSVSWAAVLLVAVGNALFHDGGGIDSLESNGSARSGVFVSGGALGVGLGTLAGRSGAMTASDSALPGWPLALAMGVCILLILWQCRTSEPSPRPGRPRPALVKDSAAVIWLCLLSVAIRAYAGAGVAVPWKTAWWLSLLPPVCAFLGKLAGGFLADWLGARRVGVTTLLLSIPLLCFGSASAVPYCLGLVLFNMTMAITLWRVFEMLPGRPGFAFGLCTLALLAGTVPTFFSALPDGGRPYILTALIAVSALCLWLALPPAGAKPS